MRDLNREFSLVANEELAHLLALNRNDEITAAQLTRLDALLEQRGLKIETHIHALHYPEHDMCAA